MRGVEPADLAQEDHLAGEQQRPCPKGRDRGGRRRPRVALGNRADGPTQPREGGLGGLGRYARAPWRARAGAGSCETSRCASQTAATAYLPWARCAISPSSAGPGRLERNGMKGDRAGVRPPRRPGRGARAGTGGAWAAGGAPSELVLDFDSHLVGEAGRHRPGSAALASIPCSATSTRPARCGERVSTGQATGGRPSELERPKAVSSSNREQSGRLSVWSGGTALPVPDPGGTLSGVRSQPRRGLRYGTALTGSLTSGRDAGPEEDR